MNDASGSAESRREEIGERLAAIHARIEELKAGQDQENPGAATLDERVVAAQHQVDASRAAAQLAITASIRAFRRSAAAHERAAFQHERNAAAGIGDRGEHEREAARHRAAAAADTKRAEQSYSMLSDEQAAGGSGPGTDQALNRRAGQAVAVYVACRLRRIYGGTNEINEVRHRPRPHRPPGLDRYSGYS